MTSPIIKNEAAPRGLPYLPGFVVATLLALLAAIAPAPCYGDQDDLAVRLQVEKVRDALTGRLERLRGLDFSDEVPVRVVSRKEAAEYFEETLSEGMTEEEFAGYQRILAYLGLIPQGSDLRRMLVDAYAENVAAWYDDEERIFAIVGSWDATVFDELTVVHELTHALQDQHFDLGLLRFLTRDYDDAWLGVLALAEGDASDMMLRYHGNLCRAKRGGDDDYWRFIAINMPDESTTGLPPFIARLMTFPYTYGTRFLQALLVEGGPAAVDLAFRAPPVSSRQIISFDSYLYRHEPKIIIPVDLAGAMPQPWQLVEGAQLGQYGLALLLAVHLGEGSVEPAVSDWGGDLLVGWWREDSPECSLAYYSIWDTPTAARAFFNAARDFSEMRHPSAQIVVESDTFVSWQQKDRITYLRQKGREVLYVENAPIEAAGEVIMRLWDSAVVPFGALVPIADRDRHQGGKQAGGTISIE